MIDSTLALAAIVAAFSVGSLVGCAAGIAIARDKMTPRYRRVGSPE